MSVLSDWLSRGRFGGIAGGGSGGYRGGSRDYGRSPYGGGGYGGGGLADLFRSMQSQWGGGGLANMFSSMQSPQGGRGYAGGRERYDGYGTPGRSPFTMEDFQGGGTSNPPDGGIMGQPSPFTVAQPWSPMQPQSPPAPANPYVDQNGPARGWRQGPSFNFGDIFSQMRQQQPQQQPQQQAPAVRTPQINPGRRPHPFQIGRGM